MVIISQDVDVGWRSLNVSLEEMVATYVLDFEDRCVDDPQGRLVDTSHEACLSHQHSVCWSYVPRGKLSERRTS